MLRRILCPLLLVLAAFGQQGKKHAPSASDFRVTGTVVNALTGEGVARAQVSIGYSENPGAVQTTLSGTDGSFSFKHLAPAKYWLSAQAHGFMRQGFDEHEGFFTGIAVGRGLDSENVLFKMRPDSSIVGTITDGDNEPVVGAQVMLFQTGVEGGEHDTSLRTQVSTDDEGAYKFSHLSPGSYFVAASAQPWYAQPPSNELRAFVKSSSEDGGDASAAPTPEEGNGTLDVAYPVTFYPGVTDPGGAAAIDLQPGDRTAANISISAVPAVHLSITGANGEAGQPPNAFLQIPFGNTVIPVSARSVTTGSGGIEIDGVPPGHYVLNVQSFGKEGRSWERPVDVAGDAEIAASEPSAGVQIMGSVQLNGKPAAQAVVRLRNRASREVIDSPASAKGEFEVEEAAVKPGTYEVAVLNVENAAVGSIAASGAKVQGRSLQITEPGKVQLTISMSQGLGRVDGIALRDGKPVPGAMIVLIPQKVESNTSLVRRDQSDSDGTFTLRSAVPGRYTVIAIANGWNLEWLDPAVLQPYLKAGTPVEIAPAHKYNVKVKVQ